MLRNGLASNHLDFVIGRQCSGKACGATPLGSDSRRVADNAPEKRDAGGDFGWFLLILPIFFIGGRASFWPF